MKACARIGRLVGALVAALAVLACHDSEWYQGRSANDWAADLTKPDPLTRAHAADALYRIRPTAPSAVRALLVAMRETNAMVQIAVAVALSTIGSRGVPALVEALQDAHASVRVTAADVLGGLGEVAAPAVPALARTVADSAPVVREAALSGLERLGGSARAAIPALAAFARRPEEATGGHALHALVVLGADSSVTLPLIRAAALDTAWRSRAAAARALGAMDPRTSGAAGILVGIGLLTDPHPEVRFTAVTSLSELGLATSGVREALVRSSGDPDPRVREQARRALTPPRPER